MSFFTRKESGETYRALRLEFTIPGFSALRKFLGANGIHTCGFRLEDESWHIDIGWKEPTWPEGMYYMRPSEGCWVLSHAASPPITNPYFCLSDENFQDLFEPNTPT
jgi:hypothetical protein